MRGRRRAIQETTAASIQAARKQTAIAERAGAARPEAEQRQERRWPDQQQRRRQADAIVDQRQPVELQRHRQDGEGDQADERQIGGPHERATELTAAKRQGLSASRRRR